MALVIPNYTGEMGELDPRIIDLNWWKQGSSYGTRVQIFKKCIPCPFVYLIYLGVVYSTSVCTIALLWLGSEYINIAQNK